MSVSVQHGFLLLTGREGNDECVKGSAIIRVTESNREKPPRYTLVTFSNDGFSIEVCEPAHEILEAVSLSYKQVTRQ
jgi:hypothetical protein